MDIFLHIVNLFVIAKICYTVPMNSYKGIYDSNLSTMASLGALLLIFPYLVDYVVNTITPLKTDNIFFMMTTGLNVALFVAFIITPSGHVKDPNFQLESKGCFYTKDKPSLLTKDEILDIFKNKEEDADSTSQILKNIINEIESKIPPDIKVNTNDFDKNLNQFLKTIEFYYDKKDIETFDYLILKIKDNFEMLLEHYKIKNWIVNIKKIKKQNKKISHDYKIEICDD